MKYKEISFVLIERTPYHDVLFDNLNKNSQIKLKVYYLRKKSTKRPWDFSETGPTSYYCHTYRSYFNYFLKNLVIEKPELIIVAGYYHPKLLITHFFVKILNIRFAFWGEVARLDIKRPFYKKFMRLLIQTWIFKNAWAVLSVGQSALTANKTLGCPEHKLRNLPYTVDLEAPKQVDQATRERADSFKRRYAPEEEIIFLCAGRLAPIKAYEVALRALAQVLTRCPGKKPVLLLAGDGAERPALEELVARLGISNYVHFLGWCQPEDMKALFNLSDILVHPAQFEPFGVAVLEAMAWSMPVLASNRTMAAVDHIRHGETGFIHEVGDVAALADHMMYFLKDPSQINIMGYKARKGAAQWPASRHVQTIVDLVK
jgi:glycosyltransferase involved in cell wall biosynthesis